MSNVPSFMKTNYLTNKPNKGGSSKGNSRSSGGNPIFELDRAMDEACGKRNAAIEDAANALTKYAMQLNKEGESIREAAFQRLVSFSDSDKVQILELVIGKLVDNM